MRLVLDNVTTVKPAVFDYDTTRFDNGVKHGVYYNGTQPLKAGGNGVMIGDVARFGHGAWWYDHAPSGQSDARWYATADSGDAVALRWVGPFTTRRDASLYLLGAAYERGMPALSTVRATARPLSDARRGMAAPQFHTV